MTGLLRGPCKRVCWYSLSGKRWIDTMKDCLKERGLDVRQVRRMVYERIVWRGFVRVNA